MADRTQDMADKLLADGFARTGPEVEVLSDPIADTPMVVTLDELRPYEYNPRVTRNRLYDEIKASILERGLDAPPSITRRPGEPWYIIRNGGNTRLSILRELWRDTKDERFFRIPCLFRPWTARGEIIALTGHLAENELHGSLTFIERALGVEKARELYEQEVGHPLTQAELARRLTADGFPIQQPHISRMRDAVQYLLPAIPNLLYGGLGRHQVERLAALRKAGERAWKQHATDTHPEADFEGLFHEVLALFDGTPDTFAVQRVQDELVGQLADRLQVDFEVLSLDIEKSEVSHRVLTSEPTPPSPEPPQHAAPLPPSAALTSDQTPSPSPAESTSRPVTVSTTQGDESASTPTPAPTTGDTDPLREHIVSPAPTTDRLQTIQRLVAEQLGDSLPSFEANVLQAIPVQAGGLYPISDVWYIEPGLDAPDPLRVHIAQFAQEIAEEAGSAVQVEVTGHGLGFTCRADAPEMGTLPFIARAVLMLLDALSHGCEAPYSVPEPAEPMHLEHTLGPLLHGRGDDPLSDRLSDTGLVKFFRLLRLTRRLLELEAGVSPSPSAPT